jgi:uncharacterized YigZ family protein
MKFKTIKEFTETTLKEKSSIFIAQAFPIKDEEEVLKILERIKKKYYDASHHCYAYKLTEEKIKYSDAGEPSGTAGIRILNAINHFDLQNILVVVIRYFGGTKLGVGLLGKTYYNSAETVLENASKIEKDGYKKIIIEVDVSQINNIYHLIDQLKGKLLKTDYADDFRIECLILSEQTEQFEKKLKELSKGNVKIKRDKNIIFL